MSEQGKNTTDQEPVYVPVAARIAAQDQMVEQILDNIEDLDRRTVEEVYKIVCEALGWEENPVGLRLMAETIATRNGVPY